MLMLFHTAILSRRYEVIVMLRLLLRNIMGLRPENIWLRFFTLVVDLVLFLGLINDLVSKVLLLVRRGAALVLLMKKVGLLLVTKPFMVLGFERSDCLTARAAYLNSLVEFSSGVIQAHCTLVGSLLVTFRVFRLKDRSLLVVRDRNRLVLYVLGLIIFIVTILESFIGYVLV